MALSIFKPLSNAMGGTPAADVAADAIGLGASAFLVTALARALAQQQTPSGMYAEVDATKHLNTTIQDPIVEEDTKDALERISKGSQKTAALADYAIPAASVLISSGLGYKAMDSLYDAHTADKLKEEKAILTSLHKKLVMARALQSRGQLSDSMYNDLLKEVQPIIDKSASDHTMEKRADINWSALLGLVLATSAALGAYGVYNYQASRNPARLKHSAIRSGLNQYAMQNSIMRPIEHKLTDDPKVLKLLQSVEEKSDKASPTETPVVYNPVTLGI